MSDAETARVEAARRIQLSTGWSLWPWLMLRGAGFSVELLLALASPDAATAADRVLALEQEQERAEARVLDALHAGPRDVRKRLRGALKALRQGTAVDDPALAAHEAELAALRRAEAARVEAEAARAGAEAAYERIYAAERVRASGALREIAMSKRFREALLWQNRGAAVQILDELSRKPSARLDSAARRKELAVASYLQRYCAKNDSIGFFGPFGWGELSERDEVVMRPGPELAHCDVYFEAWTVDAIAAAIAGEDGVRPVLAPRLSPRVRVEGERVHHSIDQVVEVPEEVARLLSACDGERNARAIARELVADVSLDVDSEEEVYDLLEEVADAGLVFWTLEVPTGISRPEEWLSELVEAIEDAEVRGRAGAHLAPMLEARERVRAAAGDPDRLARELAGLDEAFVAATGAAPTRRAGQTYGARTLVYPDGRRDFTLALGRPLTDKLGPVLSLLATSARWYTYQMSVRYRAVAERVLSELAADAARVSYTRFWRALAPHFPERMTDRSEEVDEVVSGLVDRWAAILRVGPGERRVERRAAEIAEEVARAFEAPHPGWPSARHIGPDVLIAARDTDAIRRGAFQCVMGELHLSNTMLPLAAAQQLPDPEPLQQARADDLGACVTPVETKELALRSDMAWRSPLDLHLEVGAARSWRPRQQVLRVADLVVERGPDGSPVVVDLAGGRRFDVIAFLEQYLTFISVAHFQLAPAGRHSPRITIDDVVVTRESWRFDADELRFARLGSGHLRFVAARRWAREHGLPRWVFVKVPEERKPVYVDFDSPIYVDMLARLARGASRITLSEMVPAVDETWLPDAEGKTYTCELRMVAVDPEPWRPPGEAGHG